MLECRKSHAGQLQKMRNGVMADGVPSELHYELHDFENKIQIKTAIFLNSVFMDSKYSKLK